MKRISTLLLGGGLVTGAVAGPNTIPLYENWTTLTNVPQIDARAFANYGSFSILEFFPVSTPGLAYDFMNVQAYTNRGEMAGSPGFLFNTIDDSGRHSPAEVLINDNGATIQALNGGRIDLGGAPTVIRIHADKVVNRGIIDSESSGLVEIRGEQVDLQRSGLGIQALQFGSGFHDSPPGSGQYLPDEGITDLYWGMGEQDPRFASSSIITAFGDAVNARAPLHCVTNFLPGFCFPAGFGLNAPLTFVYTNEVVTDTNLNFMIDVAVIRVADPYLNVQVNFAPSSQPTNFHRTIAVQLESGLTNVINADEDSLALYMVDRLAAETNFYLLTNVITAGTPYRPATIEFTRNLPFEFAFGAPPNWDDNSTNLSHLIYNPGGQAVTNVVTNYIVVDEPPNSIQTMEIVTNIVTIEGYAHDLVTNLYHGAAISITNLVTEVPPVPGGSITNASGRVEIYADTLNLERARIRGEGHLTIQTDHLISTRGAAIDGPSLLYNLGSTNGLLQLERLVLPEVQRLAGGVETWSGVWTNSLIITTNAITNSTITNITVDPESGESTVTVTNDPGTNIITTNLVGIGLHVMMVDASVIQTRYPTFINGIQTHSTNVFVNDTTRVLESLQMDARSLTIERDGRLVVGSGLSLDPDALKDWKVDHFPNLTRLTNQGLIAVPDQMLMGVDRVAPYDRIEIRGTNVARSHRYRTTELFHGGFIASAIAQVSLTNVNLFPSLGPIELEAQFAEFNGGSIDAGGDLTLTARELKLRNSTNGAVRGVILDVADSLTDSGAGANVQFTASQGIHLRRKPARGALLGTTVRLEAPRYQLVTSTWAAEDRGATADGYQDNAAIGRLVLSPAADATLQLQGIGGGNALYVDFLEIVPSAQASLVDSIAIDPDFTLYFADANMDYATLTNAFPDRVVWVSDFVGPNSRVAVLLNSGQTIFVNRGFRESPVIDSDADGTANGSDISPFDGVRISDFRLEGNRLFLTWTAAARTTYRIEAAEGLPADDWTVVREFNHAADEIAEVTVEDTLPAGLRERYYRVTYSP